MSPSSASWADLMSPQATTGHQVQAMPCTPKETRHVLPPCWCPHCHCTGSVAQGTASSPTARGTVSPAPGTLACREQPASAVPKAWPWQSDPWAPSPQQPFWGGCDPAFSWGRGQTTVPRVWEQGEPLNPRWGVGRGQWCGAGGDGWQQAGATPWLDTTDGHGMEGQREGRTAMGGC